MPVMQKLLEAAVLRCIMWARYGANSGDATRGLRKPLASGSRDEVYCARDTKLQRDVALKILPEAMARDAQRMARFEREARITTLLESDKMISRSRCRHRTSLRSSRARHPRWE